MDRPGIRAGPGSLATDCLRNKATIALQVAILGFSDRLYEAPNNRARDKISASDSRSARR